MIYKIYLDNRGIGEETREIEGISNLEDSIRSARALRHCRLLLLGDDCRLGAIPLLRRAV